MVCRMSAMTLQPRVEVDGTCLLADPDGHVPNRNEHFSHLVYTLVIEGFKGLLDQPCDSVTVDVHSWANLGYRLGGGSV